tara:strand:- start:331 stop:921 length:591 start_codon:yes stop_codon:yes gene_type:complete
MRLTALATAFLATLASTAQAQDRTIPLDWSGPYVSASLGVSDNSLSADFPTTAFSLSGSGDAYGVALGYQRQSGRMVYGGEIAAWDVNGSPSSGTRRVDFDDGLRASGRLGVSMGRALIYGTVGVTSARISSPGGPSSRAMGYVVGGGVDLRITPSVDLGVEYLHHRYRDPDDSPMPPFNVEADIRTVGLKLTYRF